MARSERFSVTPNVEYCLDTIKQALTELPDGDLKTKSQNALNYLVASAEGKPQEYRGRSCDPPIKIKPG